MMIEEAIRVLEEYERKKAMHADAFPDRAEVVAHATLSAIMHHWPSRSDTRTLALLQRTLEIKIRERSRWIRQRHIALAKAAKAFAPPSI